MPTYEYECTKCGHRFEAFQSMNEKPLEKCPECRKKVKRLISSGSGIIFKGSGFYATDYRKKSPSSKESNISCQENKEGCHGCKSK
ncbi:MAG: zinc ribbon domain-containing protein [Candidatus Omnitrophica bacterium]|nr:zinc ribbon domain-containing protein [Candidatus Omnitrophota bacterium]